VGLKQINKTHTHTHTHVLIIKGAFHLVTQVNTNIVLSSLAFNKQRQNDTCVDLSPNGKHPSSSSS